MAVAGDSMPRPPLTKRLRPADWVALDCVVAVLLTVVFVVGSTRSAYGILTWVAYLLALVSTLPVTVRRLWPLPVLGVVPGHPLDGIPRPRDRDPRRPRD